jgi:hypothetical protein
MTVRESNPDGGEIYRTRPDRPGGLPSLLYKGYRVSPPGIKRTGHGFDHPPSCSARVKETAELYLLPLWAFMACPRKTFTFTLRPSKDFRFPDQNFYTSYTGTLIRAKRSTHPILIIHFSNHLFSPSSEVSIFSAATRSHPHSTLLPYYNRPSIRPRKHNRYNLNLMHVNP